MSTPIIINVGTPNAGNIALGGVPTVYYFDISRGRGEVIRLLFEDAGIAFTDVRWSIAQYNEMTPEQLSEIRSPVGTLPVITIGTESFSQSYPFLRWVCDKIGAYAGKDSRERYLVEVVSDIAADMRTKFVDSRYISSAAGMGLMTEPEPYERFLDYLLPRILKGLEIHLSSSQYPGPFVLGTEISYADFVLYSVFSDCESTDPKIGQMVDLIAPAVRTLQKAVEARENIVRYRQSDRSAYLAHFGNSFELLTEFSPSKRCYK